MALGRTRDNRIDAEKLKLMEKSGFLINASRGSAIVEDDLYMALMALKVGQIAGFCIDVFIQEPPDFNQPIFKLQNNIFTPHNAALTNSVLHRMFTMVAHGVIAFLRGNKPEHIAFYK